MSKVKPLRNRRTAKTVLDHVQARLVRAGFSQERAEAMVEVITEDDVTSELTRRKIGALGDGSILQWLRDNREKILKVVEFFFSILTLIKVTDEPTEETPTE